MQSAALRPASTSRLALALGALLLAGCANFSRDGGVDTVSAIVHERAGQELMRVGVDVDADSVRAAVDALLSRSLSADGAVRIALMNNPGLQAVLAELGISEAELVQAGRLPNPGLHFGRMRDGGDVEIERSVVFNLLGLLTMPARVAIERQRFEQVQRQVALEAVRIAGRTRQAYYRAVAAGESLRYMEQIRDAADAGAELGTRMARAGNWNKLNQSRQQVFYAEAAAQLARQQHAAIAAREELVRQMGLWGSGAQLRLPLRLPDLPPTPKQVAELERQALSYRADVRLAKLEALALAATLKQDEKAEQPATALRPERTAPATRAGSVIDNFLSSRDRRGAAAGLAQTAQAVVARKPDDGPEQRLVANRLDLQVAQSEMQARAAALGLVSGTSVVEALDLAYQNKSEGGHARANGFELGLELPIFDFGDARREKTHAQYLQAVHRATETAVRARSEVREAYAAYRTAYDLARHYRDEIVPLRKTISDEMLLQYNGMLVSVFDLLADAKDQVGSVNAAIEAQRDFWVAESNLQMVLTGGSGEPVAFAARGVAADGKGGH